MEHTLGPLEVESGAIIQKGTGIPIAKMDREPGNGTMPVERDQNARRFVACWNACEGVPTEVLEALKE